MAKNFANAQDLVDIERIEQGAVILKNGALRQVIMVNGINFALKSETEQNVITGGYQNFLNSLDFPIQIIIHSRKINIEKYLENLARWGEKETSPLLQNQADEYREFIRGFVEKNAIMEKVFLVVVPFVAPSLPSADEGLGKFMRFFGKKDKASEEKASEVARTNLEENLAQLKQRTSQILEGLFAIGLDAIVLNNEQLVELFYNFYNPETIEKENINIATE